MKGTIYTAWLYTIPVGFILLEDSVKTGPNLKTIRGTWVDPDYRGMGVGEKLLKKILNEYEHRPVDILVNITKGAEGFYEKYGFKIVGHRDDFDMNIGLWESLSGDSTI